jgi:SulP family sulfate permease
MKAFEFKPKLFLALKNYSKELFMADLMAGIIVGIVALPLAIAFGIASGVSPEKGIITAIIAGFIISMMGGSKVQIGGPTRCFLSLSYMELYNNTVKPDSSFATLMAVYCLSY